MIDIKGTVKDIFSIENLYMLVAMVVLSVAVKFVYPRIKEYFKFAEKYSVVIGVLLIGLILGICSKFVLKGDLSKINIGAVSVIVAGYIVIQMILDELVGINLAVVEK